MNIIINFNLKPLNQTIVNNEETIHCNIFDFLSLFEEKILFAIKNQHPLNKIVITLPNKDQYFQLVTNDLNECLSSYPDRRYKYCPYFKKDKSFRIINASNSQLYQLNSKDLAEFILKELQNLFPNIYDLRKAFSCIKFSCDCPETLKVINNFSLYLKRC